MRFFYTNLIDASGAAVTAFISESGYPPSNVQHEFKTKIWKGTSHTDGTQYLRIDLGSAQSATALIIFNHTLPAGGMTLYGSSNAFASSTLVSSPTAASGPILSVFSSASYRYWQINLPAVASTSMSIGRVFLGTYYSTTIQPDFDGFSVDDIDRSVVAESISGQTYSDNRGQRRRLKLDWSGIDSTEQAQFATIAAAVGRRKSLFVQVDPSGSGEVSEVWYVKFAKLQTRKVDGIAPDGNLAWVGSMEFDEQL